MPVRADRERLGRCGRALERQLYTAPAPDLPAAAQYAHLPLRADVDRQLDDIELQPRLRSRLIEDFADHRHHLADLPLQLASADLDALRQALPYLLDGGRSKPAAHILAASTALGHFCRF